MRLEGERGGAVDEVCLDGFGARYAAPLQDMNHVQPHRHLSLQTATPPRLGLALAPAPACIPPPAHLVRTRRCRVHVAQRQPENEVGGYAQWQEMDDNLYVYQPEEYDEEAFDDVIEVEGEDGTTRHVRMEYVWW